MKAISKYWWILLVGLCATFWWLFPLALSCVIIGWLLRDKAEPFIKALKEVIHEEC